MDDDEQAVRAAAERRARALASRDAAALQELHHPCLRWTTHRGDVLDRDAYITGNTEDDLVWHSQRLTDVDIVVTGDVAVLTGVVVDDVERDGERQTFRLHLTQTWLRRRRGWVCLAGHAGPEA